MSNSISALNDPLTLKVHRLRPDAKLPTKAFPSDAGWDLHAAGPALVVHGGLARIPTGIAIAIPPGWCGLIVGRSGLAARGVVVLGGLIDHGYAGEVVVVLGNVQDASGIAVEAGDRVAQLVLMPAPPAVVVEADGLAESERGDKGFGSSGNK